MATAIAYGGLVVGVSTFSLLTPMIVRVNEDQRVVEAQMKSLGLPLAGYCTLVMILILLFFQNEPKLPPSKSRALQLRLKGKRFVFWKSFARLLRNRNYVLLWISHGINGGLIVTSHASVNVLVLAHFKNGERDAGRLSLLFSTCGFFLAIIMGKVLDKTKQFKAMMIFLYTGSIFSIIAVGLSFHFEIKWAMYLSFTVMGIFMHSYQTTSFDTCAEITYPEPEIFCVSMLNLMNQVFAVFTITCSDKLIVRYGDAAAYCLFLGLALLGFTATLLTADERRRQNANDRSRP
ncbi:feline leukemia virus subgroup C receptor-related protein 2-like [Trichogramma pretiosum]|uniref:feline leukemia virus subgroup C receptor-related protein 2-like n=1 Tax=Trichogramma pretiosum TaxID=7493 RepID=UPI000C71AC1A|nr:feline leukemia virus subgroup C receptor-related protein 2-like [Trichogramma pretiosum]